MKGRRKGGIIFILVCLLALCCPLQAQEGSTALTAEVPEQPSEKDEDPAGTQPSGKDEDPAGTQPSGKDEDPAGTQPSGKDEDPAGTQPSGKDENAAAKSPSGSERSTGVKTGDETDLVPWSAAMLSALGILTAAGISRRKNIRRR